MQAGMEANGGASVGVRSPGCLKVMYLIGILLERTPTLSYKEDTDL